MKQSKLNLRLDNSRLCGNVEWGNEKGMVMVMAVMMLTVVLMLAMTAAVTSTAETRLSGHAYQESQAFHLAEGVTEYGLDALQTLLQQDLDPTQNTLDHIPPPAIPGGYSMDEFVVAKDGPVIPEVITVGDYKGLNAYVQKFKVTCTISRANERSRIARSLEHQFVPPFQFGVFYADDLEIFPGPHMIFEGRIHCNADIYIGAETSINVNSYLTAVGQIYHWRKDGGHVEPTGPVNIRDYWGDYQNMYQHGYWLDSEWPTWETEAISRWGGMVKDSSHNVQPLWLPLPQTHSNQIEIIKRGQITDPPELIEARYYYKADIRVLDGVAYDSLGSVIDMGDAIDFDSFYDQREERTMYVTELDIEEMIDEGVIPSNGIIYISGSLLGDAVRIVNGTTLPADGLTVVSDNPIYILGDYNRYPKRPAAVIGDAITILSDNWQDYKSTWWYTNRVACDTWVNACFMTGNTETDFGGGYNGGLENLPRFLEKWTGKWLHFRGSLIDLWFSEQAVGPWSYGYYYSAPNRDWGFDPDLLSPSNWPPGTPRCHTVQRGVWRQIG